MFGTDASVNQGHMMTFLQALRERGWVEGQNLLIEWRFAQGQMDRFPALAAELVRLPVDVLCTSGTPGTRAGVNATRTIPIVFVWVSDPVGSGLARPGGNVTGAAGIYIDIVGKFVELLREAVPQTSRLAVLWDPANRPIVERAQHAAQTLGVTLHSLPVGGLDDIESAFAAMTREGTDALVILSGVTTKHLRRAVDLALTHRLPTMFWHPGGVRAGGLMSYTPNSRDMFRRAAYLVDRILKGANPAELPVEQPTEFDLVTAPAVGDGHNFGHNGSDQQETRPGRP
jgi:putative ABC transport system substrate-binding protein